MVTGDETGGRDQTWFDPDDLYWEVDSQSMKVLADPPEKVIVRRSDGTIGWEGTMDEFLTLAEKIAEMEGGPSDG